MDKKLQKEAGNYPKRSFGKKSNAEHKKQIEQAYERQKALKAKGIESEVLWQEPFVYAQDSVEFEVYVIGVEERHFEPESGSGTDGKIKKGWFLYVKLRKSGCRTK